MRRCDMRGIATVAVVLGLAAGLLGMFAFSAPFGRAGAASVQQREDQVTIFGGLDRALDDLGWQHSPPGPYIVALDTADYPAGSVFRFETVLVVDDDTTACGRLFDLTDGIALSGTELCYATSVGQHYEGRLRSEPFALLSGGHEYIFEGLCEGYCVDTMLTGARVIVEWTETSPAVGGIALLPDVSDSSPSNYIALAALAAVAVVALSAGARYARRRWLR
jgi:hypothetical protein